jgi:hypothetical protein
MNKKYEINVLRVKLNKKTRKGKAFEREVVSIRNA